MKNSNFEDAMNMFFAKEDTKRVAEKLSYALNCFGFPVKTTVESFFELNRNQFCKVRKLAFAWLDILNQQYMDGNYDDRNERSVTVASKIYNFKSVKKNRAEPTDREVFVAKWFSREHKTIQQIFSSVVFRLIDRVCISKCPDKFLSELNAADMDADYWWSMPMI